MKTTTIIPFEEIPLTVAAKGEVITSNVSEFRELVRAALGVINRSPSTDEDFGQAELDVKALKTVETRIVEAKDKALQDAETLYSLLKELDETSAEVRDARLTLEKTIKDKKEEVKNQLVEEYLALYDIDPRDARRQFLVGLQNSVKGKRTLASMRESLEVYQMTTQAQISKARGVIDTFVKAHGSELVMDRRELELKGPETVEMELRRRFDVAKAERERKAAEEEACKARMEAEAAKKAAEAAAAPPPPQNVTPIRQDLPAVPPAHMTRPEATEAEEWAAFRGAFFQAMGLVKVAREGLKHSVNKGRVAKLAEEINAAWKGVQP